MRIKVGAHWSKIVSLLITGLVGVACAGSDHVLTPARATPAALGTINTSEDNNGNTALQVTVDHLPEPEFLSPELHTFVVWIRPSGGGDFLNVGQLAISDDRSGELETKTPHSEFDVLVTAESSGSPSYPSAHTILDGRARR